MTDNSDWLIRLQGAVEALDRSLRAPDWLKLALRDALAVAPELAPVATPDPTPPEFYYPH